LNVPRSATLLVLAAVACAAAASTGVANFADAAGFSGRNGATCVACHNRPMPASDDAKAVLEGVPSEWDVGATYPLTVRIEGGPAPAPAPQPQGGFDLAVQGGELQLRPEDADKLRLARPDEATYKGPGTLQRDWRLAWVAPGLEAAPAEVSLWLAVVSANGNHVIATNASDGGESLDSVDAIRLTVPPSAAAVQAWRSLPLAAPEATANRTADGWVVQGRHADTNATAVAWSLDGAPWDSQPTGSAWRLVFPGSGVGHRLSLRSEGADRTSPEATLQLGSAEAALPFGDRDAPAPFPLAVGALLGAVAVATRRT
jgi:hypothetical protein